MLGASVWAKPAKFGASVALTAATLALLLRHISVPARGRRVAVGLVAWLTGLELVIIAAQSVRGVASHFNSRHAVDTAMFGIMGVGITVVGDRDRYLGYRASASASPSPGQRARARAGGSGSGS